MESILTDGAENTRQHSKCIGKLRMVPAKAQVADLYSPACHGLGLVVHTALVVELR